MTFPSDCSDRTYLITLTTALSRTKNKVLLLQVKQEDEAAAVEADWKFAAMVSNITNVVVADVADVDEGAVAGDRPAVSDRLHAVHHHRERHRHLDCAPRHRGIDNFYTISTQYLLTIYAISIDNWRSI